MNKTHALIFQPFLGNEAYFGHDFQHNKAYQLHEQTGILFLSYTALLQCIPGQSFLWNIKTKNCNPADEPTHRMNAKQINYG